MPGRFACLIGGSRSSEVRAVLDPAPATMQIAPLDDARRPESYELLGRLKDGMLIYLAVDPLPAAP